MFSNFSEASEAWSRGFGVRILPKGEQAEDWQSFAFHDLAFEGEASIQDMYVPGLRKSEILMKPGNAFDHFINGFGHISSLLTYRQI